MRLRKLNLKNQLDLPLQNKYKSNRDNMQKPIHLQACREYVIKYLDAKLS